MYQVEYSDKILQYLNDAAKHSTSVIDRIQELEENPLARARPTNNSVIGEYYVNAGRYCILMDIDQENSTVTILSVRSRSWLHKILSGWLDTPDN
jgi:mRNA-degrading endonuclease RelE of RelBE toxin-antitoxin system